MATVEGNKTGLDRRTLARASKAIRHRHPKVFSGMLKLGKKNQGPVSHYQGIVADFSDVA